MIKVVGKTDPKNLKKFNECGESIENFDKIIGDTAQKLLDQIENLRINSTDADRIGDATFIDFLFNRFLKREYPFKME